MLELRVGVLWKDHLGELRTLGRQWECRRLDWAATGEAAAQVIAPYLSSIGTVEVLLGAQTPSELERAAADVDLRPMDGGRLVPRPFASPATARLARRREGVSVAPWPTVFADLRLTGVRGGQAAEHLRELCDEP